MTVFLNLHVLPLQSTCVSPWALCTAEIINPLWLDTAIRGAVLVRLLQGTARKEIKQRGITLTGCFCRLCEVVAYCFSSTDCNTLYKGTVFINLETGDIRKGRLKDFPFKEGKSEYKAMYIDLIFHRC